jgi:glycosyltransferase involved in cell wall biosynthesis
VGARQFKAADLVICVSSAERDLVAQDFPAAANKLRVIPNGTVQRVRALGQPDEVPDERMVLAVGRLERYKNLDLLIKAFHAMRSNPTLTIVGTGPDRIRLEELSAAISPDRLIKFTGRIPDEELDGLLARATVVTSASDHEAFGLILADGLAAGARVVASDIPAHRELGQLAGGQAPIEFVDPHNVPRYADALERALGKGRFTPGAVQLPSWDRVAEETRTLYAQVISGAGSTDRAFRGERV